MAKLCLASFKASCYKKESDTTVSFCHPWQNETYEFENSCLYSCGSFQTQFCLEPRASVPVLSFDVRGKT
ncbi:conserved hypothetical protein [Treponema phagedenis]|uniref:Uncharacterized protein n=1 Tax=Treponema phagedenis TaxID=162 RepID=A0A0B7H201_TREPH|nr:conserved hypothetical protein [Treponema phagedenis]